MKIKVKFKGNNTSRDKQKFLNFYIKFLFDVLPLNKPVEINFVSERVGKMTTGSRKKDNSIFVLTKGRILRDILRTLGHEWVHEYQMDVLKREMGPNIGGRNENEANSISAMLIKVFEEKYPEFEQQMYE